jgi:hypothetical protein
VVDSELPESVELFTLLDSLGDDDRAGLLTK